MPDQETIDLLCQLTHANTLQQLCDLTYRITGNPVFVSDLAHTILSYTKCVKVDDPIWMENVVEAHLQATTLRQDREVGSVHVLSGESQRPVLVNDSYLPYPRLIKALIHEGQTVGVLVMTAYLKPFGPKDMDLLELISSFVVPCVIRERYHISASRLAVENFLIKLLDGARVPREEVKNRLEMMGYSCRPCSYVLTICSRDGSEFAEESDLNQILYDLSALPNCRVFLYNASLVCLYGSDKPVSDWNAQEALMALLSKWDLIAGASRRLAGLEQFLDYYLQAREILEMGRRLGRKQPCYSYDSLSSFLMLDRITPPEKLKLYCHQQIQELGEYDKEHGTELCATLQVYLEQGKSLSRTADILFVHRNTVRYRINRCMELLDNRLEDGNEIFAYIFSLRILEYQSKILRVK